VVSKDQKTPHVLGKILGRDFTWAVPLEKKKGSIRGGKKKKLKTGTKNRTSKKALLTWGQWTGKESLKADFPKKKLPPEKEKAKKKGGAETIGHGWLGKTEELPGKSRGANSQRKSDGEYGIKKAMSGPSGGGRFKWILYAWGT